MGNIRYFHHDTQIKCTMLHLKCTMLHLKCHAEKELLYKLLEKTSAYKCLLL